MACFTVPAAEAIITTAVKKNTKESQNIFVKKLSRLNNMLWGGAALLMFEHIWHGEVVPYFPFLTNAANPEDAAVMLHEMATSGVAMAILVTAVWAASVVIENAAVRRAAAEEK